MSGEKAYQAADKAEKLGRGGAGMSSKEAAKKKRQAQRIITSLVSPGATVVCIGIPRSKTNEGGDVVMAMDRPKLMKRKQK